MPFTDDDDGGGGDSDDNNDNDDDDDNDDDEKACKAVVWFSRNLKCLLQGQIDGSNQQKWTWERHTVDRISH